LKIDDAGVRIFIGEEIGKKRESALRDREWLSLPPVNDASVG
jgi:hypothetical protein